MSVIDLDMQLPRALAWRKANTSPLLAVLLATYSACQTCELSIKVDGVGFCRDWLPAYPLDHASSKCSFPGARQEHGSTDNQ